MDNRMGLWQWSIEAEQVTELGWLLYSTRQQDEKQLAHLLSRLTGEKIGTRWRSIRASTSLHWKGADPDRPKLADVRANHLKCDTRVTQAAKHKIAQLYGANCSSFPDGTKMRLIPTILAIIFQESKERFGLVVVKQATFLSKVCTGTSLEFSQNILFDYIPKDSDISLQEAIMDIKSSKFPG